MSSVNNVGNNPPIYSVNRTGAKPPVQAPSAGPSGPARGKDSVELSGNHPISQMLQTLKAGGDVRADKVAAIKAQIANGTYEDDSKLDTATDRMLDDVLKD